MAPIEDDNDNDFVSSLSTNSGNRTYLITYSQLDHNIFPTRANFGYACVAAFGGNNVEYFSVGKEPHSDGKHYHYHAAIKLTKTIRWKTAKNFFVDNFKVSVNFAPAPNGGMYSGAFRYATKSDSAKAFYGNCIKRHPNLDMIGKNMVPINANLVYRQNRQQSSRADGDKAAAKRKRITKGDVATFIIQTNINSELALMNAAKGRRDAGDPALNDFVFGLSRKSRAELVEDAWRMERSDQLLRDEDVDRMQMLQEHASKDSCECNGLWLRLALDLLLKNGIDRDVFTEALRIPMIKGRDKDINVILVGPADCGKSFLLQPITKAIPNTFENPAKSMFGWLGVDKANAVFLNDLRWIPRTSQDFLSRGTTSSSYSRASMSRCQHR